jgi:glycosyltransferase involved in cell wall biosynthesis
LRIAIIGTRGIPASYGGFETFAEQLATRLVERGHDVTVYGRRHVVDWQEPYYRGVRIVLLPTIPTKYTDTPVHTLLSCLHAVGSKYDVVLACNAANSLFLIILRLFGVPTVLNVDGIERLRRKWGAVGRGWYRLGEYLATKVPNAVVSDAEVIRRYYHDRWNLDSTMIPYGADIDAGANDAGIMQRLGIERCRYVLVVTRLEPENNADFVIRAFKNVDTEMRLVVVGDAPYASAYKQKLQDLASEDNRVVLAGFVYGDGYRTLQSKAYAYVQATEVGGTHPALIEAMALCGCVIANGTPENTEVLGETGTAYSPGAPTELTAILQRLIGNPGEADAMRTASRQRIRDHYTWDAVTDAYVRLLERCHRKPA